MARVEFEIPESETAQNVDKGDLLKAFIEKSKQHKGETEGFKSLSRNVMFIENATVSGEIEIKTTKAGKTVVKGMLVYGSKAVTDVFDSHISHLQFEAWGSIAEAMKKEDLKRQIVFSQIIGEMIEYRWAAKDRRAISNYKLLVADYTIMQSMPKMKEPTE